MTDKVVGLNGAPVKEPEYDVGVQSVLEDVIGQAKTGKVIGLALVAMISEGDSFSIYCSYHGPKISLLGGVGRLAHKLNKDMDVD